MRTLVAFFASHWSDVDWPRSIAAGAARSVIAGAGGGGAGAGSTGRGAGGAAASIFFKPAMRKNTAKKTNKLSEGNFVSPFLVPSAFLGWIYQFVEWVFTDPA